MILNEVAPIVEGGLTIDASTFAPVVTQIASVIGLALVAGMGLYALIKGVKMVPKALGWFIKG